MRQFKLSLSQTNAFQIASSNIAVANILMSAYLLVLVFADALRVNVLSFRNQTCLVLNAVLYIASEMTRFCKVISIFLIMLKIRYPFKHQCIWVTKIAPLSLVILVISICLYMVFQNSCKLFSSCDNFLFDQFCTLGMCHTKALHTLTPLLIFIFDLLFFYQYLLYTDYNVVFTDKLQNPLQQKPFSSGFGYENSYSCVW